MHPRHSLAIIFLQAAIIGLMLTTAVRTAVAQDDVQSKANHLPKRLVADYTAGSKYLDPPYDVAQIPFGKLTHVIHAGVPWNSDGSLAVPSGFVEPQLIKRAHQKGVKVMLLTGGDFGAIESSSSVFDTVAVLQRIRFLGNDSDGNVGEKQRAVLYAVEAHQGPCDFAG